MQYKKTYKEELGVSIELTAFAPEGKTGEWHAMLHVEPRGESFAGQYRRIRQAETCLLESEDMKGFKPEQQRYLYAPTHLNRTSEYGVSFERGTLLQFGDRNHAIISGTASINNKGEVEHVGDVEMQTRRMLENVETLLAESGMTMDDAAQIIVYLRDGADYEAVSRMFREKFPQVPTVFTLAPVCRPTWLIEMECIAIRPAENTGYGDF